jgi:hypothetical protein
LETTRNAELDSENVIKGEGPEPAWDKVENVASDTRRAGDNISEIISSGMWFAISQREKSMVDGKDKRHGVVYPCFFLKSLFPPSATTTIPQKCYCKTAASIGPMIKVDCHIGNSIL